MAFQLDTSGVVWITTPGSTAYNLTWDRLSPFTQGYIEALLRDLHESGVRVGRYAPVAFSDLAPATLAWIMDDCGKWQREWSPSGNLTSHEQGVYLWNLRQADKGSRGIGFPPLTPYLGNDGKIYLGKLNHNTLALHQMGVAFL